MSDTIIDQEGNLTPGGDAPADEGDVRRMLHELQRKHTDTERELASERNRRTTLESTLTSEQIARTTAEAERDNHAARVTTEAELRWNAEKGQATTAIASAEQALSAAEEDYARHAELGEWKDAAKAQREMAQQTTELHALQQKQQWLDNNKERLVPKQAPKPEQPRRAAEPAPRPNHKYAEHVGDLIGGEEAWLDNRPQFQSDPNYRQDVMNASAVAGRKHQRGTEPYLREIERILGEEGQQQDAQDNHQTRQPAKPAARSNQSPDLPASRRSGPGEPPAGARGEVRLSADEVEVADGLYGDPNSDWYIGDTAKRYSHYAAMRERKAGRA